MLDWIFGYLFIMPLFVGLLIFYIFPFFQNLWLSFYEVDKFGAAEFCGTANYIKLFQDKSVFDALINTLKYVVVTVPLELLVSLAFAVMLNADIHGKGFYRTLYFLPTVTMSAAVAMVWKWMYNEQMGVFNSVVKAFGGRAHNWLTNPNTALYAIMVVGIWMAVGHQIIILLAGMQEIPKPYYEAASIDGAGIWDKFLKITVPLLTPTIFFVLITALIEGFQVFDTVYMMIDKMNPAYEETQTMVMLFYRQAFDYGHKGYAAAISILLFSIIMFCTVIQFVGQRKWVKYGE